MNKKSQQYIPQRPKDELETLREHNTVLIDDLEALGYEYQYVLDQLAMAVEGLKYIANSCPGPDQLFETENKNAALETFKKLGEE